MTGRRPLLVALLSSLLVAPLVALPSSPAQAQAAPADVTVDGGATITVGDGGPDITDLVITAGQTLTIRNDSSAPIATDIGGLVTSGQIAPGGAHVVAPAQAAVLPWSIDGASVGTVTVSALVEGADADLLVDVLPDTGFVPTEDVVEHPTLIKPVRPGRIIARFERTATVADARAVLERYGLALLGSLQPGAVVSLGVADPGDFSVLDPVLDSLRSEPALAAAALETITTVNELPEGMGQGFSTDTEWRWDETEAPGTGSNWWLETIRAPQTWNLLEVLDDPSRRVAIIDRAFDEGHPSLRQQSIEREFCNSSILRPGCNADGDKPNHGTLDAAIVGAAWDGSSTSDGRWGFRGVDPEAGLDLVPWGGGLSRLELFNRTLDLVDRGASIRAINYSSGIDRDDEAWLKWIALYGDRKDCGPGPDDDGTGSLWCVPSTLDEEVQDVMEYADAFRDMANRASDAGVMLTVSAGNDGGDLCVADGVLTLPDPTVSCSRLTWSSSSNSELAMLASIWEEDPDSAVRPNPILVAESIYDWGSLLASTPGSPVVTTTLTIADQSLYGGDLSSPAVVIGPCGTPNITCRLAGTSQAAPQLAGAVSLLSAHPSRPGIDRIRTALLSTARPISEPRILGATSPGGTPPPLAPVLDVWAAFVSLGDVEPLLADLNDNSLDGNRRLDLTAEPAVEDRELVIGDPLARTAPDGEVDMRDFRRLRDGLLQACRDAGDCPSYDVRLDGSPDNPHFDLNGDGCVFNTAGAPSWCEPEDLFARGDLNGDGRLSLTAVATVPTGLGTSAELTDLEVLARAWTAGPDAGWGPEDLISLVESGDVTVSVAGSLTPDVTSAELVARSGTREVTRVPVSAERAVVTLPADQLVELRLEAVVDGELRTLASSDPLSVGVGEDQLLELCPPLRVDATPGRVRPGGASEIVVAVPCSTVDAAGADVALSVTPAGSTAPTLAATTGVLDEFGSFTTTLTAGDGTGRFTVEVDAVLDPAGRPIVLSGSTDVLVAATHTLEIVDTGPEGALAPTPVIADDGRVAWLRSDGTSAQILSAVPGGRPEPVPGSSAPLSPDDGPAWIGASLGIDEVGGLVGLRTEIESSTSSFRQVTELLAIDRETGAEFEQLRSVIDLSGTPAEPFAELGLPDVGPDGSTVLGARRQTGSSIASLVRPDRSSVDGVVEGAPVASANNERPDASRPDRAEDGTTAINGTTVLGVDDRGLPILDEEVLVGADVLGSPTTIAAQSVARASEGWAVDGTSTLGRQVGISDTGRALVFVGDRGTGPGLYLSVRNDAGAWATPVPLAGAAGGTPTDEFGSEDGVVRFVADVARDADVDVIHQPDTPGGLAGSAVAVFEGTPNLSDPATGLSAEQGLFVLPFRVEDSGSLALAEVTPLVQVGDPTDDGSVVAIETHEAIAVGPTGEPGDHRVVWWERTDTGVERIVRATAVLESSTTTTTEATATSFALASDTTSASRGLASTATSSTTTTASTTAAPPIAAMTVSDTAPEVGADVTVVNRSVDGTSAPIAASIELAGTTLALAASGVTTWTPDTSGPATLTISATTDVAVSAPLDVTVIDPGPTNQSPIVDGGGPYTLRTGNGLLLDASSSSDPDGDPLSFAWDLNLDGSYGERAGAILTLGYAELESFLCGGDCTASGPVVVSLRVDDGRGGVTDADVTIAVEVVTEDFSITVQPTSQPINAGDTVEYVVSVGAVGAFDDDVTLTIDPLPAGWVATFESGRTTRTVFPPRSTTLRVTPPSDAAEGVVETISVTGTSGTLVRSSSVDTQVVFGLIPECAGSIAGVVTDAYTGMPIGGAEIVLTDLTVGQTLGTTSTAADGSWSILDVPAFVTQSRELRVAATDYWGDISYRKLLCDTTVDGDAELVPELTGSVAGRAVEGVRNPDGSITPIGGGLAGVEVRGISAAGGVTTTAADGSFRFDDLGLNQDNAPRSYRFGAALDGYWPLEANPMVRPLETAGVRFTMVRQCTASVAADVTVIDQNGDRVANSNVRLDDGVVRATTGDDGTVSLPATDLLLGPLNAPRGIPIEAFPPSGSPIGSAKGTAFVQVDVCGAVRRVDVVIQVTVEDPLVEYFADVVGTVTDVDTGLPVEGAEVTSVNSRDITDASGRYLLEGVSLGFTRDPAPFQREVSVVARASDYIAEGVRAVLTSDTVSRVDIEVDRQEFGVVLGTVTDADTGEPVPDVAIATGPCQGFGALTAADGTYLIDDLLLIDNEPRPYSICAYRDRTATQAGYYVEQTSVTASPDPTVVDFQVVRICDGATIRGTVVNAETGEPLEGVSVVAGGVVTLSGADGSFVLSRIEPGPDNSPRTVDVVASKDGFITLTRSVTVFCGAQLFIPFGEGSTQVGTITGTVTDGAGAPVSGAFVGAEYGGSTTTLADGTYELTDAPLGADGGARTWTVTALDGDLRGSADATVTATTPGVADIVLAQPYPNRAPVAFDIDPPNIEEDSGPTRILLPASDPDDDVLAVTITRPPSLGAVTLDGLTATYTPDPNASGVESFAYVVEDPGGLVSNEATVGNFVVVPVDDPPVLDPIADQTIEAGVLPQLDVPISGTDIDDTRLSFSVTAEPILGLNAFVFDADTSDMSATLRLSADLSVPAGDYGVRVFAADGTTEVFRDIIVTVLSDAVTPVADDVEVGTSVDTPVQVTFSSNVDPATAEYQVVTRPDPSTGTLTGFTGDTRSFTPAAGFVGTTTFTYRVVDWTNFLSSDPATVTVTVTGGDTAPTADDLTVTTDEDVPVAATLAGGDVDGDPLAYRIVTAPESGTLSGTAPDLVYVPDPDTNGTDTFTYVVDAGGATSSTATVTVTVQPVDDAPVLQPITDRTITTGDTETVTLSVTDVDGGPADLDGTGLPTWATFTDSDASDGTGTLTLTPGDTDLGTTTLTVGVTNGITPADTVSFDVSVLADDTPPTAQDVAVSTDEETPVTFALDGDDPDGDPLTYRIVTPPSSGTLTGSLPILTYAPATDVNGTITFTYEVDAGGLTSSTATVTIDLEPVDDPPVLQPITDRTITTGDTETVTLSVTDVDGGPADLDGTGLPTWATFTDSDASDGTGTLTLTPGDTDLGTTSLTITATNGTGPASEQSFDVTVTAPPPPVADVTGPDEVEAGATVALDASASTGANVTFGWTAIGGTLDPTDAALVSYTAGSVPGDYVVAVTVTDRLGRTDTADAVITVVEPSPPPPSGTPGRVTGGGWVGDGPGAGSEGTNFGFQVRSDGANVRGTFTAVLRDIGIRVVADQVDALTVSGGTATFSGTGSVDGVPGYRFTVSVTDPVRGRDGDTFSLTVSDPDGNVLVEPPTDPTVLSGQVTIHTPSPGLGKR